MFGEWGRFEQWRITKHTKLTIPVRAIPQTWWTKKSSKKDSKLTFHNPQIMNKIIFSLLIVLLANFTSVTTAQIAFIENKGQQEAHILYETKVPSGQLFLEGNQWTFNLVERPEHHHTEMHDSDTHEHQEPRQGHAFKMHFEGATNAHISTTGNKPLSHYNNYFIGNDQSKWTANVPLFEEVTYHQLYDKIDLQVYSKGANLKYDFIVEVGGNPQDIQIRYEGLNGLEINNENLVLKTALGTITDLAPIAYQIIGEQKRRVPCKFVLENQTLHFDFPDSYNPNYELIIDPELVFSTYSGSEADNWGFAATYDNEGHLYAGSIVFGTGYPTTVGTYDANFNGGSCDVAISKFTPDGSDLVYSTYFGGNNTEIPHSMIVNNQNQLVVMGTTGSYDFPSLQSSFDQSFNAGTNVSFNFGFITFPQGSDLFITVFSQFGTSLIGTTFFGQNNNDGLNLTGQGQLEYNYGDAFRGEIAIDEEDNVYIVTCTESTLSFSYNQSSLLNKNSYQDGLLAKFNSNLSNLEWYTYLGSDERDAAYSLRIASNNDVYVCGGTSSSNFTGNSDGLNTNYQGGQADGFIAQISNDGQTMINSTFIGTNQYDQAYLLDLDDEDNVYVFGQTEGIYPVSENVFSQDSTKQFIHKLTPDLSTTLWSTTFGNGDLINLTPSAFTVGNNGHIYLSGWGGQTNNNFNENLGTAHWLLTTNPACDTKTDGSDFYFMALSENAEELVYATYFGGSGVPGALEHTDGGTSRISKEGVLYQAVCAGCSGSDYGFPTTNNSWSLANQSDNCNIGLIKFDFETINDAPCEELIDIMADLEDIPSNFQVYPSIAHAKIWVDLTVINQPSQVVIFNSMGQQMLLREDQQDLLELPISSYPTGLYFVVVEKEGKRFVQRFVKE